MSFKFLISIFFLTFCAKESLCQTPATIKCLYATAELMYACFLNLNNPGGFNAFTMIEGTHQPGKTNEDVEYVYGVGNINSLNFPKIICNTFVNAKKIHIITNTIKAIDAGSFKGCSKATYLNLMANKISKIDSNSFEGLGNLLEINLGSNNVEELPAGVFKPLVSLQSLTMYTNLLKVIPSYAFGNHVNLTYIYLSNNLIEAIGPAILDNTAVSSLLLSRNVCVNKNFNNVPKETMRPELSFCFENYGTISTALPPQCSAENVDKRVCALEDKNGKFIEDMTQQVNALKASNAEMMKIVNELSNRTCSCA